MALIIIKTNAKIEQINMVFYFKENQLTYLTLYCPTNIKSNPKGIKADAPKSNS